MTDTHRAADPEDARVFSTKNLSAIQAAIEEVSWLLGRGYPIDLAVRAAGDHHQLPARARMCVTRAACAPTTASERRAKRVAPSALAGTIVDLDALNIVVALEVARGTGLLFRCPDSALRDLAGLRGSYKPVHATQPAIELLVGWFAKQSAHTLRVWIDEPVSNSGQIRRMFLDAALLFPALMTEVSMVRDADSMLAGQALVVSADAVVIDQGKSWINFLDEVLPSWAPSAWVLSLQGDAHSATAIKRRSP